MKINLVSSYMSFFSKPTLADSKLKHVLWYGWFSIMGLIISYQGLPPAILILKTGTLTAFIAAFVYLLNDAADSEMDKLNPIKSGRPIPSGLATKYHALQLSLIGGVIGISIAFTINTAVLIFAISYMILGFMYSVPPFNLKKRMLMKETTLVIGLFLATGIGALASGTMLPSIFYVGAYFALFIMTLVPAFWDALDLEEDRLYGCKTIAILLKQKRRLELSATGLIVMMVTTPLTYKYFGFNIVFPIIVCVSCLLFLRFIFPMLLDDKKVEQVKIVKGSKFIQLFMLILQLSFVIGSLHLL